MMNHLVYTASNLHAGHLKQSCLGLLWVFKLKCLKSKHLLTLFALRAKLMVRVTQIAQAELAK